MTNSTKHLPWIQVMISGSWDPALHQAPCSAGSLLLSLSQEKKKKKKKFRNDPSSVKVSAGCFCVVSLNVLLWGS